MAHLILSARPILLLVLICVPASVGDEPPRHGPVAATVETTLSTRDDRIRQLAFDGDWATGFASANPPGPRDHFTLVLDEPVSLKWIAATTGRPDGGDAVRSGTLEVSPDGTTFRSLSRFADGTARGGPADGPVRAIRIRPDPADRPIAIRELVIDADPPVSIFRYPVEFVVDTSDAPDLKAWAEATARACEHAYAMINDELGSDGYRPPRRITLTISAEYRGVSGMSGDRIVGSADHFRRRRGDDDGAIVHETVHVAQGYRRGPRPSWLVEGICDYVRFFKWEPGKLGRIDPERAHYDRGYRVTAAFLAYLVERYDRDIVRRLNRALRAGEYDEDLFRQLTGKDVQELDEEWRATLRP
jgi:Peptidase of plants and bacteria